MGPCLALLLVMALQVVAQPYPDPYCPKTSAVFSHSLPPLPPSHSLTPPRAACGGNGTCCILGSTEKPGCCPFNNGTCCGLPDSTMGCCPQGLICDPIKRNCARPDKSEICAGCLNVVHELETAAPAACNSACGLLPPQYRAVCLFIVNLGLCGQGILTPGLATSACSIMQLCNSEGNTCVHVAQAGCLSHPQPPPPLPQVPVRLLHAVDVR